MDHEFENEVWESCLKTAVIKNSLSETENIMADPEFTNINVPKHYEWKMRKMIICSKRKIKLRSILKYASRTAAAFILIAGISSVFFMQFEEVRSACNNVLVHVFEKYIEFDFTPNHNTKTQQLVLEYIPQGFELSRAESDRDLDTFIYENGKGSIIALACFKTESVIQMDHEHFKVSNIMIKNIKGKYFEAEDEELRDYILWNSDDGYFMLSSDLNLEEMKKIAENINFVTSAE